MSCGSLKLFANATTQLLVMSAADPSGFVIPQLLQGDTLCVEFQLLERDPDGNGATTLLVTGVGSYSVYIGITKTDGTMLTYQNSFTDDTATNIKSGLLSLSTAAIDAAITASTTGYITAVIQIRVTATNGSTRTVYLNTQITIVRNYLAASATAVPPSEIPATQSWVQNVAVMKSNLAGDEIILQSTGGKKFRFRPDEDGQLHSDPIT